MRKKIAHRDGNAADIINDHLAKIEEILDEHNRSPLITPEFAARWAAVSPEGYKSLADAHLIRAEEVGKLLDQAGEDVDYVALRYIAFSGDKPDKRVGKYIELKHALEAIYPEDDHIEQWMINQAAAFSNTVGFAQAKLITLRNMKRAGVFNVYLDRSSDDSRSLHEVIEDKAGQNLPENVAIYLESYAERQAQTETYLSNLNTLDRLAVEAVFGFVTGVDVTELQEELGVDSLEDYVMNEVVPHLKLRTKEQTSE